MRKSIFAISIALMAACGSDPTGPGEPSVSVVGDTTFVELPTGTSVDLADLTIGFEAVTEDSRCPFGAVCVWAGNVQIELGLVHMADSTLVRLNSTNEPKETDFAGHRISFRDLTPYPVLGQPQRPGRHVAHLAIFETP